MFQKVVNNKFEGIPVCLLTILKNSIKVLILEQLQHLHAHKVSLIDLSIIQLPKFAPHVLKTPLLSDSYLWQSASKMAELFYDSQLEELGILVSPVFFFVQARPAPTILLAEETMILCSEQNFNTFLISTNLPLSLHI